MDMCVYIGRKEAKCRVYSQIVIGIWNLIIKPWELKR